MKSFFSKKSILGTMAVAAVCMLGTGNAQAQEFTIQGDLVSSYVWRGIYQGGAASFQPTLGFSVGNFSLTAWGSTSLSESNKEIDLTAAYKFGEAGPTLSVASLWWNGQADVANGEYPAMKETDKDGVVDHQLTFAPVTTQYVRVIASPEKTLPEWHGGKGKNAFLFVDEIKID